MAERELPFPQGYYPFDKGDMKKLLDQFSHNVRESLTLGNDVTIQKTSTVYYAGMGASGIGGDLLGIVCGEQNVLFVRGRGYDLPANLPKDALLLFVSYSGNTEEVLSCYKQAVRMYKNVVSVSCGGRLMEMAKLNRTQHILVPKGLPPRSALAYLFFPLLLLLSRAGILPSQSAQVKAFIDKLEPKTLIAKGIEISDKLKDRIPLIYASEKYFPIAYRWKTQVNENAKLMAFCHEFPELNHNELVGYTFIRGNFYGIILRFDDDHRRIQKRMDLTKSVMKRSGVEVTELALKGDLITKMFTAILLGDYASYFLALRYKVDPMPVKLIEKFKTDMGPFV